MDISNWINVIPGPGRASEVAQELLALAPDPNDVRTINGGNEFLVPPDLADAYHALSKPKPPRGRKKESS